MTSRAYNDHLSVLLQDAEKLETAHRRLRTDRVGRQWGLGALNRGVVILSVSAWEAYVEEVVKESLEAIRPAGQAMGVWPVLNAAVRGQIGRFNNPNPDNVRALFSEALGLLDVTAAWHWEAVDAIRARERLAEALRYRHEIAHGVNPRPTYTTSTPSDFLGSSNDSASVRTKQRGSTW